jgi:hypothetical protein
LEAAVPLQLIIKATTGAPVLSVAFPLLVGAAVVVVGLSQVSPTAEQVGRAAAAGRRSAGLLRAPLVLLSRVKATTGRLARPMVLAAAVAQVLLVLLLLRH